MLSPKNMKQHKIPEVYLKKWGYVNESNQPMVSIMTKGEHWLRQKSIGSFLAETNIFDIDDTTDERIPRLFEDLNTEFDNRYNNIVSELERNEKLGDENYSILIQLLPNFMIRTDYWRNFVHKLLDEGGNGKLNFLKVITSKFAKASGDYENYYNTHPLFQKLVKSNADQIINRVLILFISHLLDSIAHFEITFLKSQEGKYWLTSDNPVIANNKPDGNFILVGKDSDFFLPLSPKILAYYHYPNSVDKSYRLRNYETNKIHQADDSLHQELMEETHLNALEHIIFAGELKATFDKKTGELLKNS